MPSSRGGDEKLIVKWRTQSKGSAGETKATEGGPYRGASLRASEQLGRVADAVAGEPSRAGGEEFTGLFIFGFDAEGRIARHTIEHAEGGQHGEFIGLTDWLLGRVGKLGKEGDKDGGLVWNCWRSGTE